MFDFMLERERHDGAQISAASEIEAAESLTRLHRSSHAEAWCQPPSSPRNRGAAIGKSVTPSRRRPETAAWPAEKTTTHATRKGGRAREAGATVRPDVAYLPRLMRTAVSFRHTAKARMRAAFCSRSLMLRHASKTSQLAGIALQYRIGRWRLPPQPPIL